MATKNRKHPILNQQDQQALSSQGIASLDTPEKRVAYLQSPQGNRVLGWFMGQVMKSTGLKRRTFLARYINNMELLYKWENKADKANVNDPASIEQLKEELTYDFANYADYFKVSALEKAEAKLSPLSLPPIPILAPLPPTIANHMVNISGKTMTLAGFNQNVGQTLQSLQAAQTYHQKQNNSTSQQHANMIYQTGCDLHAGTEKLNAIALLTQYMVNQNISQHITHKVLQQFSQHHGNTAISSDFLNTLNNKYNDNSVTVQRMQSHQENEIFNIGQFFNTQNILDAHGKPLHIDLIGNDAALNYTRGARAPASMNMFPPQGAGAGKDEEEKEEQQQQNRSPTPFQTNPSPNGGTGSSK